MPEIFNPSGLLAPLNHFISLNSYGLPLLLYFLYTSNPVHLATQGQSLESSLQWWTVVTLFIAGLGAVTFNVAGPFRYGKQQYGPELTKVVKQLPDWALPTTIILLVLLPWSRVWLLVLIPITWKYTREYHREAVQNITDLVDAAQAKAVSASRAASQDAVSAARYEDRAYEIAAMSWRDVRAGQNLRVADYYDKEAQAWAAIDAVLSAATDAADSAQNVDEQLERVQNRDKNYGIASLYTMVRDANNLASDAKNEVQKAQDRALGFKAAAALVKKSRDDESSNAKRVTDSMIKVANHAIAASSAARRAREIAEEVLQIGTKAKTTASLGDMILALEEAKSAGKAAKKTDDESKVAEKEKNSCRAILRTMASG